MNAHQRRIAKRKLIARAAALGITPRPHAPLWRLADDVRAKEKRTKRVEQSA